MYQDSSEKEVVMCSPGMHRHGQEGEMKQWGGNTIDLSWPDPLKVPVSCVDLQCGNCPHCIPLRVERHLKDDPVLPCVLRTCPSHFLVSTWSLMVFRFQFTTLGGLCPDSFRSRSRCSPGECQPTSSCSSVRGHTWLHAVSTWLQVPGPFPNQPHILPEFLC